MYNNNKLFFTFWYSLYDTVRRFQVTVRIVEYRTRMALGIVLVCLNHKRIKNEMGTSKREWKEEQS